MIGSKRMTAVPQVRRPHYNEIVGCCEKDVNRLGGLGYCKRHTPYLTIQHMGIVRYSWEIGKLFGEKLLRYATVALIVTAFMFGFYMLLGHALDTQATMRCMELKEDAEYYAPFYLTESEKKMCDSVGIEINAPVR